MDNFAPIAKPPMSVPIPALLDKDRLPRHIAIIMDGNGRWAKDKGEDRLFGHYHGVESVRDIVEGLPN